MQKFLKGIALVAGVACFSLVLCFAIMAWSEPGSPPPDGNVASPINTGGALQTKIGGLNIMGNVGIGTTVPAEKIDVDGRMALQPTTAPAVTANKLYNVGGDLYWNGVKLNASAGVAGVIRQTISTNTKTNISTNSSSWRDIADLTTNINTNSSKLMVMWDMGVACQGSANMAQVRMLIDGAPAGGVYNYSSGAYDYLHAYQSLDGSGLYDVITVDSMSGHAVVDAVGAGSHTIKLQWRYITAGLFNGACYIWPVDTGNGFTYAGTMTTMEITK